MITNLPNPSCCRTSNPNHLCPKCKILYNQSADDSLRNNVLPLPTINWAEEQTARLANRPSYLGKGPPPGTEVEEPAPMFAERTFDDLLAAGPTPAEAPPIHYPPQGTLVTNEPEDVKGNVLPTSEQMWEAMRAEDRRQLGL